MPHHQMTAEMQRCIDACQQCHLTCLVTLDHCLGMGGHHSSREHINTLLDCIETCSQSVSFMARHSDMHHHTCGVCAEACMRCADSCERLANGDAQMLRCAQVCRECAAECREMAHGH